MDTRLFKRAPKNPELTGYVRKGDPHCFLRFPFCDREHWDRTGIAVPDKTKRHEWGPNKGKSYASYDEASGTPGYASATRGTGDKNYDYLLNLKNNPEERDRISRQPWGRITMEAYLRMFGDEEGVFLGRRKTSEWQEKERERLKHEKKLYSLSENYTVGGVPIGDQAYLDKYRDQITFGDKWNTPTYGNRTVTCNDPRALNYLGAGNCIMPPKCEDKNAINYGEYGECNVAYKINTAFDEQGNLIIHKHFIK